MVSICLLGRSFGKTLFSIIVLSLHAAYVTALVSGLLEPRALMLLALAAYATYVVNASQFLLKLRAARLDAGSTPTSRRGVQLEPAS